uniref:Uncharacterized protein n=1 Tax=Glossina palpalis gambiensis TaxID=67801 RepID=A0A1B0BD94_9MUSC
MTNFIYFIRPFVPNIFALSKPVILMSKSWKFNCNGALLSDLDTISLSSFTNFKLGMLKRGFPSGYKRIISFIVWPFVPNIFALSKPVILMSKSWKFNCNGALLSDLDTISLSSFTNFKFGILKRGFPSGYKRIISFIVWIACTVMSPLFITLLSSLSSSSIPDSALHSNGYASSLSSISFSISGLVGILKK